MNKGENMEQTKFNVDTECFNKLTNDIPLYYAEKEQNKKYDVPLAVNLCDADGNLNNFVLLKGEVKEKITLEDLINGQIEIVSEKFENKASAQLASSGDSAQLASSGDYAQLASSGYYAQLASSGGYAQLASSGYYTQLASSGYCAKLASSGDYAQLASSGASAQLASSGDSAKLASSGDYAQLASSGACAQLASSGDYTQLAIEGKSSVGCLVGKNCYGKGIKGSWLGLVEFNSGGQIVHAEFAQIGSEIFKDLKGKVLKENTYYALLNKKFTEVEVVDGSVMVVLSRRKVGEFEILKTKYAWGDNDEPQYVAKFDGFAAHGADIKQAISDCNFKRLNGAGVAENVKRVKEKGTMKALDYRLLTGACQYGTNKWLEEKGLTWDDEKSIDEVIGLTSGEWGHDSLVKVLRD